jgi:hypothetical protein
LTVVGSSVSSGRVKPRWLSARHVMIRIKAQFLLRLHNMAVHGVSDCLSGT